QERLQGAWRLVSLEVNGGAVHDNDDVVFVFAGRRFLQAGRKGLAEGTYRLHLDRNPRGIDGVDLKITEGADADTPGPASKFGIYQMEGDRLTMRFGRDGQRLRRPAEFATEKDSDCTLVVLERVGAAQPGATGKAGSPQDGEYRVPFVDRGTPFRGAGQ